MSYDCGELYGDSADFETTACHGQDGTIRSSTHGYDDVFGCSYDEVRIDAHNRWHMQSYFPDKPNEYPTDATIIDYRYRVENDDSNVYFDKPRPTQSMLDYGEEYNENFYVVEASLNLSLGPAEVSLQQPEGDYVTVDNYNYVEWGVDLGYWGESIPGTQEESKGVKVDVNLVDGSDVEPGDYFWGHSFSQYDYAMYCGSRVVRSTPQLDWWFLFQAVE